MVGEVDVESAVESFGGAVICNICVSADFDMTIKGNGAGRRDTSTLNGAVASSVKTRCFWAAVSTKAVGCDGGEDDIGHGSGSGSGRLCTILCLLGTLSMVAVVITADKTFM